MKTVKQILEMFPEVMWDRFSGTDDNFDVFGWIKRDDGKFDFVDLWFVDNEPQTIITSSAKYSEEFGKRLGMDEHSDCKRVESFYDIKNCIRLK